MVKAVVDTNIFISGLLNKKGIPRKIFLAFKDGKFELVISPQIFTEILKTLNKPELIPLILLDDCKEILIFLENFATFVYPEKKVYVCRDMADNIMLECAVTGKVNYIVTGDNDLLDIQSFCKIPIVTAHKFLKDILK
ncbi:MAG: putative toxin-antitoxin system toxin component, PIN family [Candidatus Hydrogenedentota bacterium]